MRRRPARTDERETLDFHLTEIQQCEKLGYLFKTLDFIQSFDSNRERKKRFRHTMTICVPAALSVSITTHDSMGDTYLVVIKSVPTRGALSMMGLVCY
jgi:hypothetical protein